jgi:hypothetical protein
MDAVWAPATESGHSSRPLPRAGEHDQLSRQALMAVFAPPAADRITADRQRRSSISGKQQTAGAFEQRPGNHRMLKATPIPAPNTSDQPSRGLPALEHLRRPMCSQLPAEP